MPVVNTATLYLFSQCLCEIGKYRYPHLSRGKHKKYPGQYPKLLASVHLCSYNFNSVAKYKGQRGVTPTEGIGIAYVNVRSEYKLRSGWKTLNTGNSQSVPSHPWHALISSDRSGQQMEPSAWGSSSSCCHLTLPRTLLCRDPSWHKKDKTPLESLIFMGSFTERSL